VRLVAATAVALALAASAGATPPWPQLSKLYAYEASASLSVRVTGTSENAGFTVIDLSYASPVRGRVPAYLVLPAGDGPFPVVLWAPGSSGTRDEKLNEAMMLAKRGVAEFLFTPPHIRPGGPYLTSCDARKDVATVVQYVKEMRRAIDVIVSYPELDAERIGYVGFSLGADFGGILAGVEKRIAAYALESGRAHYTVFPVSDCATRLPAGRLAAYRERIGVVNAIHYVGHAAPAALLIQNGSLDPISPRKDVLALYGAASGPKTLRWYRSTHRLPAAATAFRDDWLLSHLR
jgi:cephalosporin-C deacetylase-like acetyl esterase